MGDMQNRGIGFSVRAIPWGLCSSTQERIFIIGNLFFFSHIR